MSIGCNEVMETRALIHGHCNSPQMFMMCERVDANGRGPVYRKGTQVLFMVLVFGFHKWIFFVQKELLAVKRKMVNERITSCDCEYMTSARIRQCAPVACVGRHSARRHSEGCVGMPNSLQASGEQGMT